MFTGCLLLPLFSAGAMQLCVRRLFTVCRSTTPPTHSPPCNSSQLLSNRRIWTRVEQFPCLSPVKNIISHRGEQTVGLQSNEGGPGSLWRTRRPPGAPPDRCGLSELLPGRRSCDGAGPQRHLTAINKRTCLFGVGAIHGQPIVTQPPPAPTAARTLTWPERMMEEEGSAGRG